MSSVLLAPPYPQHLAPAGLATFEALGTLRLFLAGIFFLAPSCLNSYGTLRDISPDHLFPDPVHPTCYCHASLLSFLPSIYHDWKWSHFSVVFFLCCPCLLPGCKLPDSLKWSCFISISPGPRTVPGNGRSPWIIQSVPWYARGTSSMTPCRYSHLRMLKSLT